MVECQAAGLEVNGIFAFRRRRLVGVQHAFRIRLQINQDLTLGDYVPGLLVIFEIAAANLIEAAGIASVESDLHIMQFGMSSFLKLHRFAGLDGK